MSHLSAEACTQRLAAGRGDGYQLAAGRTCCASCGSSGEAASDDYTTEPGICALHKIIRGWLVGWLVGV